jgi:hypothetical protein
MTYARVKNISVFLPKIAASHVRMILNHFVSSMQVVIPQMLVLQVMVLNCTSKTDYGTKSVYSSIS